jgi:hypothetical protein
MTRVIGEGVRDGMNSLRCSRAGYVGVVVVCSRTRVEGSGEAKPATVREVRIECCWGKCACSASSMVEFDSGQQLCECVAISGVENGMNGYDYET